jgi:signal transduction histidine kinase/ligand-binding sensor domain-containing protein
MYKNVRNWQKSIYRLLLQLAFVLIIGNLSGQVNDININYRVKHYTIENGLSQNYIDCIYKDSRGFIWIGTGCGLNRFDGYSFLSYKSVPGKKGISDSFINKIIEDKDGNLWIATQNGLNKYIFEKDQFIRFTKNELHPETSISENWITDLLFDNDNNLWIGTLNSGVEKITFNKELTKIQSVKKLKIDFLDNNGIAAKNINCLFKDHNGFIFIGHIFGLDRLDPKTGEVVKYQNLNNPYYFEAVVVNTVFEDSEHIIWVGYDDGILNIDFNNRKLTRLPVDKVSAPGKNKKALAHYRVSSINEDITGKILIGTLAGLYKYDKKACEFNYLPEDEGPDYSLNDKFIHSVFCDKEGNVWIGTEKGGLNKYNVSQKKFLHFDKKACNEISLNNNIVNSISENNDFIWIGTAGGGLNRYDKKNKRFSYFPHKTSQQQTISNNYISTLACNNNEIWVGTWGRGYCKNKQPLNTANLQFKTFDYEPLEPEGAPFVYVSGIIYDRENKENVWIGRADRLQLFDRKKNQTYVVKAGSAFGKEIDRIGCLYIDSRNYLWVGSPNGIRMFKLKKGLSPEKQCQPDSIFTFIQDPKVKKSLSGNYVISILEDKTGKMWFSVYGHGLCRLEKLSSNCLNAEFSTYTNENGLSNNVVYGMLEDNSNNLWLSTDWGLTRYNYKTKTSSNFYETDGLQSNQFYWAAYYKNEQGMMYFGNTKGVNFFYPDSIKLNNILPRTVITDFKVFNQSQYVSDQKNSILQKNISETSEVILQYNQNNISFEFSALSYESSEKNKYKYKLEGFDEQWTSTGADRRYASYTNLNPGTYYFSVTAANNDGFWNNNPTSIKIIITPPWWQTIWFRLLVIVWVVGSLFLAYKVRIRNLYRKKIELENLVLERTKELNEKTEKLYLQTKELDESNINLKKTNDTKDKLMAIIAHDLKSPFNSILGLLSLLTSKYDSFDDEKKKYYISLVNTSSLNLYKLLENLLQWTRAQTGKIDYDPQPFFLESLVAENLQLISNIAKEKGITLSCSCPKDLRVNADKDLLNVVIRNLLNNAVKFTHHGSISVSAECSENEKMVLLKITDSGTGIDQQKLESLFNTSNIHSTKGTAGEMGTGLGLQICYEFVLRNGGNIYVESEVGKGSCFSFTLPKV